MLITGGSSGVGMACAIAFCDSYEVVTVARTGPVTEQGDLLRRDFCDYLIEKYKPDVFLNNAAIVGTDWWDVVGLNFVSAGYLAQSFYKKMAGGDIINISSRAAHLQEYPGLTPDCIAYHASKAALSSFSRILSAASTEATRVTVIEPGWIDTPMGLSARAYGIDPTEYETQTQVKLPMRVQEVVDAIRYVLVQPKHIIINTMEIRNTIHNPSPEPTTIKVDAARLVHAVMVFLEKTPFDERNQISLTHRPGLKHGRLYDGIGRLKGTEGDYTELNEILSGTYLEDVYNQVIAWSPYGIGRVRLMRMPPKRCYSFHSDSDIRYHFAIQTNPGCYLVQRDRPPTFIPADGTMWCLDSRIPHTAVNTTNIDRIHLVFCTYEKIELNT